jgi:hypothetical protein
LRAETNYSMQACDRKNQLLALEIP